MADSDLGLVLEYLNSSVESASVVAGQTIAARFAPFAISKDTPGWEALAILSANALEHWAKSIREYGNLPSVQNKSENNRSILPVHDFDLSVNSRARADSILSRSLEEESDLDDRYLDDDNPSARLQSRLEKFE